MDRLEPLLVTAALLLLPLVPAAILYYMLTPKRGRGEVQAGSAGGELESGTIDLWRFKLRFNVVGSTATYVVLLVAATWIFRDADATRLKTAALRAEALRDQQAWIVEVPVNLKGQQGEVIPANEGQMQQVRVELEPSLTLASSNSLQFWVVPNNGRFPTARFSLGALSLRPTILDLNDERRIEKDHLAKRLIGIEPVWLELGSPYGAPAAR
jgi:hypothetical protein